MIESLSDFDDSLADQVLSNEKGFDGVTIENINQVHQLTKLLKYETLPYVRR